jgi:rhamnose utilization protein RhaD (predicted bifunctional aldolase and dehydrogenase)
MPDEPLAQLVALSNRLGDPALDYAILGEGNTSVQADEATFWVKASGAELRTAGREQFVRVRFDRALAMLEAGDLDDAEVAAALEQVLAEPAGTRPSVETVIHAVCLQLEGVRFVGHTHPTWINMITCSTRFEEAIAGSLFPDQIVICGPDAVAVPYVDPGLPLAREVKRCIDARLDAGRERPKAVYLQNHGFIALGATAKQIEDITAMAVKAARILVGACAAGSPRFLGPEAVRRIHDRPDEHYRQRVLGQ